MPTLTRPTADPRRTSIDDPTPAVPAPPRAGDSADAASRGRRSAATRPTRPPGAGRRRGLRRCTSTDSGRRRCRRPRTRCRWRSSGTASSGWGSTSRPRRSSGAIAARYGLHPLAVEDAVYAHQRPKLEHYDDAFFMVLKTARYVEHEQLTATSEVVDTGEVMVFLGASLRDHGATRPARRAQGAAQPPRGAARPARARARPRCSTRSPTWSSTPSSRSRRPSTRTSRNSRPRCSAPSAPTTSAGCTSSSAS